MAYDRYETRRGWREPHSRYSRDYGDRFEGREERGFFDRAGDEVASWFGDEEAERRRREDYRRQGEFRNEDEGWRRPSAFMSDEDLGRQPRFRDEGYRRPYTGRYLGRRGFGGGDDDRFSRGNLPERGWSERWERAPSRELSGTHPGLHDPHYSEWRRRQIDALDRDYEDYRRENQNRFEAEFLAWRERRQAKRGLLSQIKEHMEVTGSDEEHVGTVDCVRGDRMILTRGDSPDDRHHSLSCSHIDRIEGELVILDEPAAAARQQWQDEERGFFSGEGEEETGAHMLNRSFSGTY